MLKETPKGFSEMIRKVEFEKQMIEVYRRAAKKVWDELQSQGVVSIIEIYQKKIAMNPEWMSLFFKNRSIVKGFPREQVEESSKAMAARDAVAVREEFIYKSHNKITPLLNLKPLREITRAAVSVRRESIDSSITFLFDDESRFTVRTQIVWVFGRVNSRPFARYPMTFHDVFVSGEKMKLPSELKVREAFMKEDSNEAR